LAIYLPLTLNCALKFFFRNLSVMILVDRIEEGLAAVHRHTAQNLSGKRVEKSL
jgi:hypothetical protein